MAYYKKVLQPGEAVRYLGRLHWLIYSRALIALAIAIAVTIIAKYFLANPQAGQIQIGTVALQIPVFLALPALFVLISLYYYVGEFIRRHTTEIVVTDRRVIYKTGLLSRRTVEMNISKIETVDVLQGMVGRILGFGTVLIHGTGAGFEPLQRIADPVALRNAILVG